MESKKSKIYINVVCFQIYIGGCDTSPAKELPADLESFLSSASEGVILISFGSAVETLPFHIVEKFFTALRKLPQKVGFLLPL